MVVTFNIFQLFIFSFFLCCKFCLLSHFSFLIKTLIFATTFLPNLEKSLFFVDCIIHWVIPVPPRLFLPFFIMEMPQISPVVLCKLVLRCIHWFSTQFSFLPFASRWVFFFFFFFVRVLFNGHWRLQDSRGGEGTIFYSAHEHWQIYLQLCMWDDYYIFLIELLVFTRLLLNEIYHLIELSFDYVTLSFFVCIRDDLILAFLLQQFEMGNWWIRTHMNYHLFITSEPTNEVC